MLTHDNQIISFIDALKNHFKISTNEELEQKMADYSFAIELNEQLFILSIAHFDFSSDLGLIFSRHINRRTIIFG